MVGSAMKIKNINDININFFAKNRYKLFDSAWRGILPNSWLDKITVESTLKNIEKYLKSGYELFMAFTDNDEPCGYVMFGKFRDKDEVSSGEIMSIYFYEEYRGQGFAQKLFSFAEEKLKAKYNKVYIWVLEINGRARRFYEKNGYHDTGKRRFQNCDKLYNEMLYEKEI